MPPMSVAITGTPAAIASITALGRPSSNEGKTKISSKDSIRGISSRKPKNITLSLIPYSAAKTFNLFSWGPSPAIKNITGLFFSWELGLFSTVGMPGPPRFAITTRDVVASVGITVLFSLNMGLIAWRQHYGTCPTGTKRVAGGAGLLGAVALLCPACIIFPIGIAGISLSLAFLAPFIPLIQIIALVMLSASFILLTLKQL